MNAGIYVASGDVNGDGIDDIITAPSINAGPHVKVWDGATRVLLKEFMAYSESFGGGVRLAAADVTGDGLVLCLF